MCIRDRDRTPTCTGPLSGPFRVRIEAWQRWGGVGQSFPGGLGSKRSRMFCDRNKTMMMQNSRTVRRSVDANEQARERAKTTPLSVSYTHLTLPTIYSV